MKNNNDLLNNDGFFVFLLFSIILHLILGYFFLFGLPSFYKKLPEEQVIVFEMLPVSEKSNVPTVKKQLEKAIENEDAKQVQQSKPTTPPNPPTEKLTPPLPPVEEMKPVEEKPVIPEKKTIEEPKPAEVVKPIEKKLPAPAEKPKTEEKKPTEPKKPVENKKPEEIKKKIPNKSDLDSLLKNLEQSSEGNNKKSNKQARSEQSKETKESKGTYDETLPLSISEKASIQEQINRRWTIPPGAMSERGEINVFITCNKDGTIQNVKVTSKICYALSASVCQALEESAIRAVWLASPIVGLDPERYNIWKEFKFRFDPSKM